MNKLQQLAELLRNVAYADNQSHYIDWSLSIIHPKTNDGDIGFSGGLWNHERCKKQKHKLSLSFSYSDTNGIYLIKKWKDGCEVHQEKDAMSIDDFAELVFRFFSIEELYNPKN